MGKFALCLTMLAASTSASTPIAEGRWLVTNQLEEALFDAQRDNSPFPNAKPQAICLTSAAAALGPGLAFSDPSLCKIVSSTIATGAFTYEINCTATESADTIVTKAAGHYTADGYTGTSSSVQRRGGMRIEMRSHIEGKRVGSC